MNDAKKDDWNSMQDQRLIFAFGHSHLGALDDALQLRMADVDPQANFTTMQLWGKYDPFYTIQNDEYVFNPTLLQDIFEVVERERPELIASLLVGSEYLICCFPTTPRRFDLVIPKAAESLEAVEAELIPYDLFFEMSYQILKPYFVLMRFIQDKANIPVIRLLPPPPSADTEFIRSHLPPELSSLTEIYHMPTSSLIYKSWCVYAEVERRISSEFKIELMSPPGKSLNEYGFLSAEFAKDSLHGNPQYGVLIAEQLAERLHRASGQGEQHGTSI